MPNRPLAAAIPTNYNGGSRPPSRASNNGGGMWWGVPGGYLMGPGPHLGGGEAPSAHQMAHFSPYFYWAGGGAGDPQASGAAPTPLMGSPVGTPTGARLQ